MSTKSESTRSQSTRSEPSASESPASYRDAIRAGDRRTLARAITLLESTRADRAALGRRILEALVPDSGRAIRVGITGPPGVGKSTFIEALGLSLIDRGQRVAVLAVDPSSPVTGGSILGDKTRMERLAQREEAFIRPSPSGGSLGGVAHRTREVMLVCEAAGFDVALIETVGIGQSEVAVASMVDFFLVLLQPGGGDELQGLKKGVMELADALAVNKADGDQRAESERTRAEYASALRLLDSGGADWTPPALAVSAATGEGVEGVWETVLAHRRVLEGTGELERRRREQACAWMWSLVRDGLREAFAADPAVAAELPRLEHAVAAQQISPYKAAQALLDRFTRSV